MHSVPITVPGAPHNFSLTYIHSQLSSFAYSTKLTTYLLTTTNYYLFLRFPFHGVPFNDHESIGMNAEEMYSRLCLPFCYLCEERKEYIVMSRLERHFRMAHLNRAVDCGSCYLILCGLDCIPGEGPRKHYHCPYCSLKVSTTSSTIARSSLSR